MTPSSLLMGSVPHEYGSRNQAGSEQEGTYPYTFL